MRLEKCHKRVLVALKPSCFFLLLLAHSAAKSYMMWGYLDLYILSIIMTAFWWPINLHALKLNLPSHFKLPGRLLPCATESLSWELRMYQRTQCNRHVETANYFCLQNKMIFKCDRKYRQTQRQPSFCAYSACTAWVYKTQGEELIGLIPIPAISGTHSLQYPWDDDSWTTRLLASPCSS